MYRCVTDPETGERFGWVCVLDWIGVEWEDRPAVQISLEDYIKKPPLDQNTSPHISGSSVTGVGKIDTIRIRVHDLTAKRVYFEPTEPNK